MCKENEELTLEQLEKISGGVYENSSENLYKQCKKAFDSLLLISNSEDEFVKNAVKRYSHLNTELYRKVLREIYRSHHLY